MNRAGYSEALVDDQQEARERERMALNRSIRLLETARADGVNTVSAAAAISFTAKLWTLLIEDLADPGNGLARELRGQLISVGIWILRELEQLRSGAASSFDDIIAVCKAIRDGLT